MQSTACMSIVGFKSWPWETPWPRHLDRRPPAGPLVSDPFFPGLFLTAGGRPCQFRIHGSCREGIDDPEQA